MRPSFVRRTVALVAAAVVSAGLVAGCTSKDDGDKSGGSGSQGPSGSFTPGAQQLDLTEPVVEQTFRVPGSDKDEVTVGVLGLELDGQLQVLHLVFTPNFASQAPDAEISLGKMLDSSYSSFKPSLVDRKNLKVYSVVDGFATDTSAKTTNHQPMYVYAVFAKPADANRFFEVRINDEWQPFRGIESVEDEGAEK